MKAGGLAQGSHTGWKDSLLELSYLKFKTDLREK